MVRSATAIEWDDDTFERILERLRAEGRIDAAGVRISPERLARIMKTAPQDPDRPGRPLLTEASFEQATFAGDASFDGASFQGLTSFEGASFEGVASFHGATFQGASFHAAKFQGYASFNGASFSHAGFDRARFAGTADFIGASFERGVSFHEASAEGALFDFAQFGAGTRFDYMRVARGGRFDRARFGDDARFRETWFGTARFLHAHFGEVAFQRAGFTGEANFAWSDFAGQAEFGDTTFGRANFGGVNFARAVSFDGVRFIGPVDYTGASFEAGAVFTSADFAGSASLAGSRFTGDAYFSETAFRDDASFTGATFEATHDFGPVLVAGTLKLDRTVFGQRVRIETSAQALSCSRAEFRRGADLLVRWAQVALEGADFAEPSMLALRRDPVPGEDKAVQNAEGSDWDLAPRLVSLRRANVGNLTIADADVRACRFQGARGLDQLRLEGVRFAESPLGWQRIRRRLVPIRWTRRRCIAEEHQWRAEQAGATGWYGPEVRAMSEPESAPEAPEQIAEIYRALRKGREDRKDEPGAADFYYGEMEMRRWSGHGAQQHADGGRTARRETDPELEGKPPGDLAFVPVAIGERAILWLYWLVSGYGLRASRALLALAFTVVAFALFFDWWGFRPDRDFGRALLFSTESTSSLFRAPEAKGSILTSGGEVLQIILRLLGPLFFGLALLSLRGRVKR